MLRRILLSSAGCCKRNLPGGYQRSLTYDSRNHCKKYLRSSSNVIDHVHKRLLQSDNYLFLHLRKYSRGLLDGDIGGVLTQTTENDLQTVTRLFPNPKSALNNLKDKTPESIFEVHYKQSVVTPKAKGKSKKKVQGSNEWTCTYAFVWPQKMKFESTCLSKKQASEKASLQALHWLYTNKRIDENGNPLYDKKVLKEIKETLNEPIVVSISENSEQRLQRIWNDYDSEIRAVYQKAKEDSKNRVLQNANTFTKDSSIDADDDYIPFKPEDTENLENRDSAHIHPIYGIPFTTNSVALARRQRALEESIQHFKENATKLPIDDYIPKITSTIRTNRAVVIVGAAGCGKSTRVPLATACDGNVGVTAVVTQPRRVAAIGLAERVANDLGEEVGQTIGYQVRLNSKPPKPPGGSILYCTSGILLKRLQMNPGLEGCTHVFIDEAHERDVNTDMTMLLLKKALNINDKLKLVIMSATLDADVFSRYFDNCPIIEVPGRTYPVDVLHLDDIEKKYKIKLSQTLELCKKEDGKPMLCFQEVAEVIKAIDKKEPEGAILVFLPGWAEINAVHRLLTEQFGDSSAHLILPVHSRLKTEEQTKIFCRPLPGVRKIVLATNIAETSITIPDVVYVLDTAQHKMNTIRERTGVATLENNWITKSSAKQRMGRAGRVQPGVCFKMYTKDKEESFATHSTPEILRIPLDRVVLDCKTYAPNDKVENFLSQLPEPPSNKLVNLAVNDLVDLGALTPTENLTPLGTYISCLSTPPQLSVAILNSATTGNLVTTTNITLTSEITLHGARDSATEIRATKQQFSRTSDHVAFHSILEEYEQARRKRQEVTWCQRRGFRGDRCGVARALTNLRLEELLKSGFLERNPDVQELNRFSNIEELATAVLLSGSNSLLVAKKTLKTKGKMKTVKEVFTSKGERAHIGSESVNYELSKNKRDNETNIFVYFGGFHSTDRRALVVHQTSLVSPHTALLFCKGDVQCMETDDPELSILSFPRHRLDFYVPSSQTELLLRTREMLWETFQYYYNRDVNSTDIDLNERVTRFKIRLFKAICKVLVEASKKTVMNHVDDENDEDCPR